MQTKLYDKLAALAAMVILLAATIFVLVHWGDLPEQIPSHYNFKGEPDAYGGTGTLIFTIVTAWILIPMMVILGKFPKYWNTGVQRTPANETAVNRIVRDLMDVMEVSMAILFAYMMIVPILGTAMGKWFMPLFLAVIFGTIMVTVVRLIRNR